MAPCATEFATSTARVLYQPLSRYGSATNLKKIGKVQLAPALLTHQCLSRSLFYVLGCMLYSLAHYFLQKVTVNFATAWCTVYTEYLFIQFSRKQSDNQTCICENLYYELQCASNFIGGTERQPAVTALYGLVRAETRETSPSLPYRYSRDNPTDPYIIILFLKYQLSVPASLVQFCFHSIRFIYIFGSLHSRYRNKNKKLILSLSYLSTHYDP